VLGTVGSRDKAGTRATPGVSATIDYKTEPVAERVKALTGGRGRRRDRRHGLLDRPRGCSARARSRRTARS
jgi:NADPH2:quinone reductase